MYLVLDLAQAEDVLGGENGAFVDERVVDACHVAWTENEAHRAALNAEVSQVDVHRPRTLTSPAASYKLLTFFNLLHLIEFGICYMERLMCRPQVLTAVYVCL